MLRASETRLSPEERFALAAAIALSGGMLFFSDDMKLLDEGSAKLFRLVARIGMEVDGASGTQPPQANRLIDDTAMPALVAQGRESLLHLLLNTGELPKKVPLAALSASGQARLIGPEGEGGAPPIIELPPHAGRIIRC
jgi:hypothetical protein